MGEVKGGGGPHRETGESEGSHSCRVARVSPPFRGYFLFSNAVITSNTTLFFLQVYHSLDPLEILSGR